MRWLLVLAVVPTLLAAGCDRGSGLPPTVRVASEPDAGASLGNPQFDALDPATARFGRLEGALYQVEIPRDWNGEVVFFLHAFGGSTMLNVYPPPIRSELIEAGYAWAASSYSTAGFRPGTAADETARLWDYVAREFRRPTRSYLFGLSLGGGAAAIAATRYADRFDGALAMCATVGEREHLDVSADFLVSAFYAAGVTQADFEATSFPIVRTETEALLAAPDARRTFERVWTALSGGKRPYAAEGLRQAEEAHWAVAEALLAAGLIDNTARDYADIDELGAEARTLDSRAVRFVGGENRANVTDGESFDGNLAMPLSLVHSTGDAVVPLSETQEMRRRIDDAGRGGRLLQRTVEDPHHCEFSADRIMSDLRDLTSWVSTGQPPSP